jgi:hypothetical protein
MKMGNAYQVMSRSVVQADCVGLYMSGMYWYISSTVKIGMELPQDSEGN